MLLNFTLTIHTPTASKYMQEKFDVGEVMLRKILTKELERRFERSIARKFINKNE